MLWSHNSNAEEVDSLNMSVAASLMILLPPTDRVVRWDLN